MSVVIDRSEFAGYCQNRWRPQLIQGFLREWLTQHFSTEANIEEPDLQKYIWTDDYDTTKIVIESSTRWNPQLIELRPAVILKRSTLQNVKLGIANRCFNYLETGVDYFVTFWKGSHVLFCIARSGAAAELLSTEVAREITEFGWHLARALNLFKLEVAQIGEVHKLEEATENFVVPVTITYAFEQAWQVTPEGPMLNEINLSSFEP